MMDFGERADGREIFGCALEDVLELDEAGVEVVQLEQRAAERDARGQIGGMELEAGTADVDRFLVEAGAAAFLGELREGDRRRILLDPASKIFEPAVVGHRRL